MTEPPITYEIQAVDGVLVISVITHSVRSDTAATRETYQFTEGELIELTVEQVVEFRINGLDAEDEANE